MIRANMTVSDRAPADSRRFGRRSRRAAGGTAQLPEDEPRRAIAPTTNDTTVIGASQPCSGPSWIPSTTPPIATSDRKEPAKSNPPSWCSRVSGTWVIVISIEATAITTGVANTHCHDALSTMNAELIRPMTPPPAGDAGPHADRPAALSGGKAAVIVDRVAGMIIGRRDAHRDAEADEHHGSLANAEATFSAEKAVSPMRSTLPAADAVAQRAEGEESRGEGDGEAVDDPEQLGPGTRRGRRRAPAGPR